MAARTATPGLGVLAKTTCGIRENVHPKLWTVSFGYRYQQSFRHFIGTVEQKQREVNRNQIYNLYHLVDMGIERQLTRRWSAVAAARSKVRSGLATTAALQRSTPPAASSRETPATR